MTGLEIFENICYYGTVAIGQVALNINITAVEAVHTRSIIKWVVVGINILNL